MLNTFDIQEQINVLKRNQKAAENQEKFEDTAFDLHNLYMSFQNAGFSEEQAWELVKLTFQY